jgi:PAS domain S-box-containing protein
MKILYLEDNPVDFELTERELKNAMPGLIVKHAKTISEANLILEKDRDFDLALLDLNLPDGSGIELLVTIRNERLPIAVAILTGSGNEEGAIAALKAGADDYITKKSGYLERLPEMINLLVQNFKDHYVSESRTLKVLYVEWHETDIDLTKRYFKNYAPYIQLDTINSSTGILDMLPETPSWECPYDVLLIDYKLPGLNAIDIIKIIKQERKLPIPIVLVTGHGSEEIAVKALKLGADEYLVKNEGYLFRLPSLLVGAYRKFEIERRQKALIESEAKYKLLADNSGDVIFTLDMGMHYTYVSPAVKALRGFEVEEVMNQKITEVLTKSSIKKVMILFKRLMPEKDKEITTDLKPVTLELEMIKKGGGTVWAEVKITFIKENNKLVGLLGVTRDISIRKKVMDELKVLSLAIEQSPASVIIANTKGEIEYVNPKFTKVSGYSVEEALGQTPDMLRSGVIPGQTYEELIQTIGSGNEWSGELLNKRKDGSLFWENVSISPVRNNDGKITHFISISEDITEKKKYVEELIEARDKAQESDRLKSAFLATMSHELRTPLNAIIGFSDLANMAMDKEEIVEICKVVNRSGNHLLNIIEDIFEISLLQTKKSKVLPEEFDLLDFMALIIDFAKTEQIKRNKQNISLKIPKEGELENIRIYSDKTKVYQVLINLVKNAIEYTDSGSVEVGYKILNNDITLFVKDTGVGIPVDKLDVIFEKFRQVDDTYTRRHGGVGLGLAICSEIAKLLNGKIWVETKEEQGSTFFFMLPGVIVLKNPDKANKGKTTDKRQYEGKTILIVEDVESNFLLLQNYLNNSGVRIIWAKSGEESVETCRGNDKIDLVLMDIRLPGIDGYEAINQIKTINPKQKIIVQTALALKEDRDRAQNENCDDYITKPIRFNEFTDVLSKHLS